jgi:hypothetical protein
MAFNQPPGVISVSGKSRKSIVGLIAENNAIGKEKDSSRPVRMLTLKPARFD